MMSGEVKTMENYVDYKDDLVINVKKLYHNLDLMSTTYPNLSKWIMYKMSAGYFGFVADVTEGVLTKLVEHQQKNQKIQDYFKNYSIKKQDEKNNYKWLILQFSKK